MKKRIWEYIFLFWIGGSIYIEIELVYRGFTHWTMFLLAGFVFVTVGWSNEHIFTWKDNLSKQVFFATLWATFCEYICGELLLRFNVVVWDYSNVPLNFCKGLVCVPFMLVWAMLMSVAIVLDDILKHSFFGDERPHYHVGKWCVMLDPLEVRKANRTYGL